jgi:hypothetical protein
VADFFLAFSQAHSNINGPSLIHSIQNLKLTLHAVIDSGPGKEASDSKIHAQLHFYSSLPSCGLTILAGSHDAGYANVLRSLVTEGRDVVLLRGGHTAWLLEGIVQAGEIEGLFARGKLGSLVGQGGAVGTGSAARPVISNGKPTPEARLKEEESARDKKRMRRRLKRQEERESRESAALDLSDSESEEEEEEEAWDTETDGSAADVEEALVKQFEGVGIRSRDTETPTRVKNGNGKTAETPARRLAEETKTPRGKTPLREMSKPAPQSWDTLVATPAKVGGAKIKGTPNRIGMTPARTPGAGAAVDDSVPVQGGDRALRYLTPRPCHK